MAAKPKACKIKRCSYINGDNCIEEEICALYVSALYHQIIK